MMCFTDKFGISLLYRFLTVPFLTDWKQYMLEVKKSRTWIQLLFSISFKYWSILNTFTDSSSETLNCQSYIELLTKMWKGDSQIFNSLNLLYNIIHLQNHLSLPYSTRYLLLPFCVKIKRTKIVSTKFLKLQTFSSQLLGEKNQDFKICDWCFSLF